MFILDAAYRPSLRADHPKPIAAMDGGATWHYFADYESAQRKVKSSISLTDEQHSFARELVESGRYLSVCGVLQQGIDLLRQRMQDEDLQRTALKALLK